MATQIKSNAAKLSRAARDYPADLYRIPTDGRKWRKACQNRWMLVQLLATYGDGDGTRIHPGIAAMFKSLCWSERKVFRLLEDLRQHGVLIDEPNLAGMRGTRVRRLDVSMLAAKIPAKGYQQDCHIGKTGLPDTKNFPVAGLPHTSTGLPNSTAGLPHTHSRTAMLGGTQPPLLTDTPPPPPPPHETGGQAGAVVLDLQRAYQQSTGKVLPVSGKGVKAKLSAMVSPYSPATVASAVEKWNACRTAPASGLRNPAQFLQDELPDFLAQVDTEAKAAAKLAAEMPRLLTHATDMTEQYWAWVKRLEEFGSAETEKYLAGEYPPPNSVIGAAVDAWVAANPPPTNGYWEVNQAGELFSIDNVNDAVQGVKTEISMATEQMGAEQITE